MTRRTLIALTVLFALAIGFRFWLLESFKPSAPWVGALTLTDAEMGRNLLAGRGWVANLEMIDRANRAQEGKPTMVDLQDLLPIDDTKPGALGTGGSAHSPGYSLWFAASYWLGGDYRYIYSQRMQAMLDASACLLLFGIGRRVWSTSVGFIAAALYAFSPANAFLANLTVAASTDSFWFIAVAYGAVRIWDSVRNGQRPWIGATILTLATLGGSVMNSTSFALPTVLTGVAIVAGLLDRRAWKLVPYFVLAQVLVAAMLLPWAARNARMFGQFSPVRGNFWQLAYAAWGELPNPWGMGLDDKYYWNWIEENCAGCDAGQQSIAIRNYLVSSVIPSPGFARHIVNLVSFRVPKVVSAGQLHTPYLGAPPGGVMRSQLEVLLKIDDVVLPVVAVLFLIGMAMIWFRADARPAALLALGPSLFLICFSLVFFVELRKTVPAYGGMFLFAAIAATEIARRLSSMRRVAVAAVLLAVAAPVRSGAAVIAGGQTHTAIATPDGPVMSWGGDAFGQLGDGSYGLGSSDAAQALYVSDAIAVAAGSFHTVALTKDGSVWSWGDNRWGELGDGGRSSHTAPEKIAGIDHIVAIAAGGLHSLALDANGIVWTWGDNHFGQSADSSRSVVETPMKVAGLPPIASITAGFYHSLAISRTGRVWAWGQNGRGQLGRPASADVASPMEIAALDDVIAVAAGQNHSLALRRDGTVWSWGGNTFGQLGRDGGAEPAAVSDLSGVGMVAAGEDHSVALDGNGQVWTWGDNLYGQLGDDSFTVKRRPVRAHVDAPIMTIASGEAYVVAAKPDGALRIWGFGYDGQLGDGISTRRLSQPRAIAAVSLAPGPDFSSPAFHAVTKENGAAIVPIVTPNGGGFVVKGEVESPTAYVISSPETAVGPGAPLASLAVTGKVIDGCVTIGVQRNQQWVAYRNFDRPGLFRYLWQPDATGDYRIVIAHCVRQGTRTNNFEILHIGWMASH